MSLISIILPGYAFQYKIENIEEIKKFCADQFETSYDNFEIIKINENCDDKKNINKIHYGIKFKESNLSISSIENLIYQRDCVKAICEKSFESLQVTMQKLTDLENEIKKFSENGKTNEDKKKELINDNIRLRDLLEAQIEYSDNFRVNTEKTLSKIKEEFQSMVVELESMRKKTNKSKPVTQREPGSFYTNTNNNTNTNNITNNNNKKKNSNSGSYTDLSSGNISHGSVPKLNFK